MYIPNMFENLHGRFTTIALGSQPKQGHAKVWAKSEAEGVTFHAPWSAGKYEGMNPHTPK
jgi:hypothetical protein